MQLDANHSNQLNSALPRKNAYLVTLKSSQNDLLAQTDIFKSVDTAAPAAPNQVKLSFNPQEPGLMPAEVVAVNGQDLKDGLVSPRVRISEPNTFPTPHADKDGNYIFTQDDPRFDDTEDYACVTRALNMAQEYLGRELPWGFSGTLGRNQIIVHPHPGQNVANAFYSGDAGSLNFFSFTDPKTQEILRTGDSSDIASHETGHALLDAIRHDYLQSASMSSSGFHESFGDMTAMLAAMRDPSVLAQMLSDTHGDLSQPNIVSNLAEGLGNASSHMNPDTADDPDPGFLRNAINDYKYADQHFLPFVAKDKPNSSMGQEPHAYSNLFTGAFYSVFANIYAQSQDPNSSFADNVAQARDAVGKLLYRGMEFAPVGDINYKSAALAMLKADAVDNDGKYRDILLAVFGQKKILTPDDVAAFDQHEANLPAVTLDPNVKDKDSAMKFLDAHRSELGVPSDTPFEYVDKRTNNKGETFLLYDFKKTFGLDSPDFGTKEGSQVETRGGLLLAFDKSGKLIEDNFDDVTDRDIQDAKDALKVAGDNDAISTSAPMNPTQASVTNAHGIPYINMVMDSSGVLRKSPVIWG